MSDLLLGEVLRRVSDLEAEARDILGQHEASQDRVVFLENSYEALSDLSVEQDELFREALRATELGLYRAAHVLAWAGFVDFLHKYLWNNFEPDILAARPNWTLADSESFRDHADYQVIEAAKVAGVYGNTLMKALHGLLNTRNECAHPSEFFPDLNDALGYLSSLMKRIDSLQKRV